MSKRAANKTVGVVLVNNIPPQITDSQLSHFFTGFDDVSSIQCLDGYEDDNHQRACWIQVSNPAKTVQKINISTIAGTRPQARLMGYLFRG